MAELIRLIDLPGVREIEAALHIPGRQILPQFDDLDERIDDLSRRLFGLTERETHFSYRNPHSWDDQLHRVLWHFTDEYEEWEANFYFEPLAEDADAEDYWTANGWDVGHDNGDELLLLPCLERQLVCVIEELLPEARLSLTGEDPNHLRDAEDWGRHMQDAARRFQASRK